MASLWSSRVERREGRMDCMRIRTDNQNTANTASQRLLSAHLISLEMEHCPGESGWKPELTSFLGHPLLGISANSGASTLPLYTSLSQ
jgi:hypothetical protein